MSRAFSIYLDAIRFLAALLVLFYHANWIYRPGILFTSLGHEAVVIFFVLSGFVIAYVADTRETDFRGFMVARGARIFSVAIPAIILTAGLDYAGFHIQDAAYPEGYRAWDYPAIRVVTSSLFLNEIWMLGIQLFTNVPYWSLNYEVWYYVLFGILFFFEGRRRWIVFGLLCLLLGPKIVLLMPVWWMGVWIYRSQYLANLSRPAAWVCLVLSLLGGFWYVHVNMGQWGWDYLKQLMGPDLHLQLSFSRQFISDYYLGAILSLHFVGLRVLLARVEDLPQRLTATIRYLAGATFSIYLFHQPLLWFYNAVFFSVEEGIPRYLFVVPCTLVTVFILSTFTEKKKHLWKRWVEQGLQLLERTGARFWQSFAR
ncbi:MAG: acyltransferase [Halioglobus sp.]|nr:acyltransferase [Halioglobus sp.]